MLAIAWAGSLAACGAGPSSTKLKADSTDPEDELAQAEARIYARLQPSEQGHPVTPPATTGTASPGTSSEPAPPTPADAPRHAQSAGEAGDDAGDVCEVSCEALASMQRAVERICAIAGSTTDRCTRARERLTRARDTVESQCEECDS